MFIEMGLLVGCSGSQSAADTSSEDDTHNVPRECGEPAITSNLDQFEYIVDGMDGCNDVQTHTISYDWSGGVSLVLSWALDAGTITVTTEDDERTLTGASEYPDYMYAHAIYDYSGGDGTSDVRLVFSGASGSLNISAEEAGF